MTSLTLPTSPLNNTILPHSKFLSLGIYFCVSPLVNRVNGIATDSKFTLANSRSAPLENIALQSENLFQLATTIGFDTFPECRNIINIIVYRNVNPIYMLVLGPLETNENATLLDTPSGKMMKYLNEKGNDFIPEDWLHFKMVIAKK